MRQCLSDETYHEQKTTAFSPAVGLQDRVVTTTQRNYRRACLFAGFSGNAKIKVQGPDGL